MLARVSRTVSCGAEVCVELLPGQVASLRVRPQCPRGLLMRGALHHSLMRAAKGGRVWIRISSWSLTLVIFGKTHLGGMLAREAISAPPLPAKVKPRAPAVSLAGTPPSPPRQHRFFMPYRQTCHGPEDRGRNGRGLSLSGAQAGSGRRSRVSVGAGGPGEVRRGEAARPSPGCSPACAREGGQIRTRLP